MATEEPAANAEAERKFAVLPAMTYEQVKARAQKILDDRGLPPYTREKHLQHGMNISEAELAVISDFVANWLPQLVQKEKK